MLGSGLSIYAFRGHEPCCLALIAGWLMGENMKDHYVEVSGGRREGRRKEQVNCMPRAVRSFLSSPFFQRFLRFKPRLVSWPCIPPFGCFLQVTGGTVGTIFFAAASSRPSRRTRAFETHPYPRPHPHNRHREHLPQRPRCPHLLYPLPGVIR